MRNTLIHIVLFITAASATLLVCELFVGNARIIDPSLGKYYKDIGKGLPANYESVFFAEGFGIFKTNSSRFAGDEVDTNTTRHINIALLGDSFVESFQIFQRDYFGNIIEKKLSERFKGFTFEVQNFGRAGFNFDHNYAYHRLFVDQFEPELVIYFISNEYLHLETMSSLYPYTKVVNDSLIPSVEFDSKDVVSYIETENIISKYILLTLLKSAKHATKRSSVASILFGKVYDWFIPANPKVIVENDYTPLPLVNKILNSLDNNVIVVNRDSTYLYESFEDEVKRLNIPYWDSSYLVDSLRNIGENPYYWKATNFEGHWNQEMHKVMGNYLSDKLIQKIEQDSITILKY